MSETFTRREFLFMGAGFFGKMVLPPNTKEETLDNNPCSIEELILFYNHLWSWIIKHDGGEINCASITNAYQFVQNKVKNNGYYSDYGPFSYWADNIIVGGMIPYNQGLYVLALKSLSRLGEPVSSQNISEAIINYGQAVLEFPFQDISGIFPEVLSRWLFGEKILSDEQFLNTLNTWFNTTAVYCSSEKLSGLKTICNRDGSFLSPANFEIKQLSFPGDYQNGGNWPLWNLAALSLAYKISRDDRYFKTIEQLLQIELSDGHSKEYWHLDQEKLKESDPLRSDYSWNILLVPLLKWAGCLKT